MDEKKFREAIELIKQEIQILEDLGEVGSIIEEKKKKHIELYNTAIEALEKQLPKKPKQSGVTTKDGVFHPINGTGGVPYDLCPNCEENLCTDGILGRNKKYMKYCEICGQRLDWTEC